MKTLLEILPHIIGGIIVAAILGIIARFSTVHNPLRRLFFTLLGVRSTVGICQIFLNGNRVYHLLVRELALSSRALIMQVRGQDLLTAGGSRELQDALEHRAAQQLQTRMLLLNPASKYVATRASESRILPETLEQGIRASISAGAAANQRNDWIALRLYNAKPLFSIYCFDTRMFLSFYLPGTIRQASPCLEIRAGSALFSALSAYFEWIWHEASIPARDAEYKYEIEEKVLIVEQEHFTEAFRGTGAQFISADIFRDHYFAPRHAAAKKGDELRIRCNLSTGEIYRTHKTNFAGATTGSRKESEIPVGALQDFDAQVKSIEATGYFEYVRFFKHCKNFVAPYQSSTLHLTLAFIADSPDPAKAKNKSSEYLEVEALLASESSVQALDLAVARIAAFIGELGSTVSRHATEAYSDLAQRWATVPSLANIDKPGDEHGHDKPM
jgi:adenylate cyclase class IV